MCEHTDFNSACIPFLVVQEGIFYYSIHYSSSIEMNNNFDQFESKKEYLSLPDLRKKKVEQLLSPAW